MSIALNIAVPESLPPISNLVNIDAIHEHVEMLHTLSADKDGQLVVASYGEDPLTGTKIPNKVRKFDIGDVDAMAREIESLTQEKHRNVYVPLHLVRRGLNGYQRGGKEAIEWVLGLVPDFDDDRACEYNDRQPLPADLVLETSQGRFQTFYLFPHPVNKEAAEIVATALQAHCECDHGTKDLAHVWRVPGTLNWPNKKKVTEGRPPEPQPVEIITGWSGTTTSVADLEKALLAEKERMPAEIRNPDKRVSGQHEPMPSECQQAKQSAGFSDADLIEKAKHARNGNKFANLMSGEWVGFESQSQADMALCNMLAFWTGKDGDRIDRIFRQSGLMRDKWDKVHYSEGATYGQQTISDAITQCREVYSPRHKPAQAQSSTLLLTDWAHLSTRQFSPVEWLVQDLLPPGVSLLAGRPKQGKSWLVHAIALMIAAGRPVFGLKTHRCKTLYMALEDSERRLRDRTRKLMHSHGLTDKDLAGYFFTIIEAERLGSGLEEQLAELLTADSQLRLIIIDVLARVRQERRGNQSVYESDYEVGQRLKSVSAKFPHACILIVHHTNKGAVDALDSISGTNGLAGGVDNTFSMVSGSSGLELHINGRDIEDSSPIPLTKDESGMWSLASRSEAWRRSVSETRGQIIDALRDDCRTPKEIGIATGLGIKVIEQQLMRLVKAGTVIKPTRGSYEMVPPVGFDLPALRTEKQ